MVVEAQCFVLNYTSAQYLVLTSHYGEQRNKLY